MERESRMPLRGVLTCQVLCFPSIRLSIRAIDGPKASIILNACVRKIVSRWDIQRIASNTGFAISLALIRHTLESNETSSRIRWSRILFLINIT